MIRRILMLSIVGLILSALQGCAAAPVKLYPGEKRGRDEVALIRSAPKALLVAIDSAEVNEKYIDKTDWRKAVASPGQWNEVQPGRHSVRVDYAGFYRHVNPFHGYVIYTPVAILRTHFRGPYIRQAGESSELIPMESDSSLTIEINLEAGHRYEIRVELTHNPLRPDRRPRLPRLIAPADKRYFIVDLVDVDDETMEPVILPVPRADQFVISDFPWRAYVVDLDAPPEENSLLTRAVEIGDPDFVELILATEETDIVDYGNEWGMTPLHLAAEKGDLDIVRILIDHGAPVDAENDMGATPLFYAAGNGHDRVVGELIEAGADIHDRQETRWTPLHHAVHGGHGKTIDRLLAAGARAEARTDIGLTPLMIATNERHLAIMNQLLSAGVNLDLRDKEGLTALHYAALNGDDDAVKKLLVAGASPCLPNKRLCTPLHNAAVKGDTTVIGLLLDAGCNVDARTRNGWTPLHLAAVGASVDAVNLLLVHGADVNARTDDGETPLFLARQKGSVFCVATLKSHGGVE